MKKNMTDRFLSRFLFAIFVSFSVFATTLGVLVATSGISHATRNDQGYSRETIQRMVVEEARANGVVPPALALAVAKVESDFQAHVESSAGARGVMQIMPATGLSEFGVAPRRLWNPRLNIKIGIAFLEQLYRQYGNRWELALSHYNGGTLKGGKGANARPHSYTRKYVADVTRHWRQFTRSRVVLAAADATRDYEKQKKAIEFRQADPDAYWLLEEEGVEKDWRDYLAEADRILEGADLEGEVADNGGIGAEAALPDWYDDRDYEPALQGDIRSRFRKSLRRTERRLNAKGAARFM